RASQVTGTVPPGGTFEFKFDFHAPPTAGTYAEYFGLVEDGVAWFSDPGQGGPADDDIEANITVTAGTGTCTVDPGVPDGGTSSGGTDGGASSSGSSSGGTSSGGTGSSGASSSGSGGSSGSGSGGSSGGLSGGDAGGSAGHGGDGGSGANGDTSFKPQGTGCAVAPGGGGQGGTGGAGSLAALVGAALVFGARRRRRAT
ncbi:MAG TPA: hypothetical protein VIY73_25125, partial [Polyangiaceae bacterium]